MTRLGLLHVVRTWRRGRRVREDAHETFRRELAEDYARRVSAGDDDALETARDYYDFNGSSTLFEIGYLLYLMMLIVTVVPLIGLFWLIKLWTQ